MSLDVTQTQTFSCITLCYLIEEPVYLFDKDVNYTHESEWGEKLLFGSLEFLMVCKTKLITFERLRLTGSYEIYGQLSLLAVLKHITNRLLDDHY